jgi:dephospho-CoA kinase
VILGLTGKYCSGKNMAAKIFIDRDWYELDVDQIGHAVLKLMTLGITEEFGNEILHDDGSINRRVLGSIVFRDKKQMHKLESIIHPEMVNQCKTKIDENSDKHILLNAAILHHMGLNKLCDSVLWIESGVIIRLKRAKIRDKLSFMQIIRRIYGQRKLDAKYWVEDVDIHIIQNQGTRKNLETEVNLLIDNLEERV